MEIHHETVSPKEVGTWKVSFSGEGTSIIQILIDGELYLEYRLNFDSNSYKMLTDNSANFE